MKTTYSCWRSTNAAAIAFAVSVILGLSGGAYASPKGSAGTPVTSAKNSFPLGSVAKSVRALVPEAYKKKGSLTIAVSATHPPNAYFNDQNKLIGWEVELGKAIATRMGLKPDFRKVDFSQILTGLQSDRYDIGLSGINDTTVRQEVVTFVDYFNSGGTSLIVKSGNPKNLSSVADLCGDTVAVETGTLQVGLAQDQSKKCVANGKKPIEITQFPNQTQVQLQLRTGRADAGLNDFPVAAYIAKQSNGHIDVISNNKGTTITYYGIAIAKESPNLVKAVQAAVQSVIDDGTYTKILKQWLLLDGAIETAAINGTGK